MGFNHYYNTGVSIGAVDAATAALYKETNDLFWQQTKYKVGQKLDPKNPADVPYMKIWMTIYTTLRKTKGLPSTSPSDAQAKASSDATIKAIEAAKAGDTATAKAEAAKADALAVQAAKDLPVAAAVAPSTPPTPSPAPAPAAAPLPPGTEWGISQYQALARKLWAGVTVPYAVISITKNGEKFLVSPFATKAEASDHYGTATDNPGTAAYIAYFDRNVKPGEDPLIDAAFFRPTEVTKEVTKEVSGPSKAAVGLGLAGALGLLLMLAKH